MKLRNDLYAKFPNLAENIKPKNRLKTMPDRKESLKYALKNKFC
jgi:hypothetical protein